MLDHLGVGPWTEQGYFDLGETHPRIELIDGSLLVTPAGDLSHQLIAFELATELDGAARAAGLVVYPGVNVRLGPDRILIPDIVVAEADDEGLAVEAADVRLVCEIVEPVSAVADQVTKPRLYADAGIRYYLLAYGPAADLALRLFRLRGADYVQVAEEQSGQISRLIEPAFADLPRGPTLPQHDR
ncbi:Putative restriction endonuclease [Asanoa hainanensis]|uniref:Putative restriction endonuclease n=1 Tax=Asanoa hainanensis TaxID=560556 RepID=A0A239LPH0_9ACTN|nr:Uma2 family endonuclease [Asanoa hainanensis]SNT31703.1 Putative restriction endonuclease [Asanoa hainanensis]